MQGSRQRDLSSPVGWGSQDPEGAKVWVVRYGAGGPWLHNQDPFAELGGVQWLRPEVHCGDVGVQAPVCRGIRVKGGGVDDLGSRSSGLRREQSGCRDLGLGWWGRTRDPPGWVISLQRLRGGDVRIGVRELMREEGRARGPSPGRDPQGLLHVLVDHVGDAHGRNDLHEVGRDAPVEAPHALLGQDVPQQA